MAKDCKYVKNEIAYACIGRELVLQQVVNGVMREKCKKKLVCHTISHFETW
jgi:hypothetical protein